MMVRSTLRLGRSLGAIGSYLEWREIPSLCILKRRVDSFIPRRPAMPFLPATIQLLFIRYWLIQRDTAQPFFSDRPTLDQASQSVRQTNATHVPPIRPFEAISDIAQYRMVSIGQGRWRTIVSERERCPPVGIMMSDQHGASVRARRSASGANDVWARD